MSEPDASVRRTAILGGAFDPIHRGHIVLAEQVITHTNVESILLVPAYRHPLKQERTHAPFEKRVEMVKIAIEGTSNLSVCTVEKDDALSGYSIDTIKRLKEIYPESTFDFVIGADLLSTLSKWHKLSELMDEADLLICARPGFFMDVASYPFVTKSKIIQTKTPDISSTTLRRLLRDKNYEEAESLLPAGVLDYIKQEGLYK